MMAAAHRPGVTSGTGRRTGSHHGGAPEGGRTRMTARPGLLADETIMINAARPIPAAADEPSSLRTGSGVSIPGGGRC